MTEKQYSGAVAHGFKNKITNANISPAHAIPNKKPDEINEADNNSFLSQETIEDYKKAGKIASETIIYAKSFIKKDMLLLEIAEKIEAKIQELGGKPAFPVNLSINEIAAHSTPSYNDTSTAHGLLKVDLGAHIQGCVADTSFSLDLENSEENRSLISSAENALNEACKIIKHEVKIRQLGAEIEKTIKSYGVQPIQNLSGHSIKEYELHAGITIPNYDNAQEKTLEQGVYAIEPFATNGLGKVRDGKLSSIYAIVKEGNVRDSFARQVLAFIKHEYKTLPFCSRWLIKKFGTRAIIAMQRIEEAGLVHHYPQLIESGNGKVAQAEHTIIITNNEKIITTFSQSRN